MIKKKNGKKRNQQKITKQIKLQGVLHYSNTILTKQRGESLERDQKSKIKSKRNLKLTKAKQKINKKINKN